MKLLVLLSTSVLLTSAADINDLVTGNNQFSKVLYADAINEQFYNGSLITKSPFSIQIIMALLQSGAKGTTTDEIKTGIFLPEDVETAMQSTLSSIPLNLTNRIFSSPDSPVTDNFANTASTIYQTAIETMEFADSADAAATLNDWIVDLNGNPLFSTSALSHDTTSVLFSNMVMEMNWANPFVVNDTYVAEYRGYSGVYDDLVTWPVLMMTQGPLLYNYYHSEELEAQFLEVPFENPNLTLIMVVPNAWNGLIQLEQQLDAIFGSPEYTQELVQFSLPFYSRGVMRDPIKSTIKSFGIETAFSTSADFSGMANDPGDIMVKDVIHGCYIQFGEEGVGVDMDTAVITKWSASQSVQINRTVTRKKSPKSKIFETAEYMVESSEVHEVLADHPFFYYIKYNGLIIFEGRHFL